MRVPPGPVVLWLPIVAVLALVVTMPGLFGRRRKNTGPTRDDAFNDLFNALSQFYAAVAALRPEWQASWERRSESPLPRSLAFGNEWVSAAGHDMRFARSLLHRYRWKSRVSPLFADHDERAWLHLRSAATSLSPQLTSLAEVYGDLLYMDEVDWVNAAAAELDDATRRRRKSENDGMETSRLIAESTYLVVMTATGLSDRLIARLRHETTGEA